MPRGGKEAMSYQPLPDYEADTAAGNPPGWYLDPIGLRSLRWWDGAQWARHTQPLLGPTWERPSPYPDATASASGGYGAVRQPAARPPPGAGRLAGWRGRCAGPGARVIPSGQDSGAAGSRPASRAAGIAGPAVPPAGTAVSSAPRITAAEEPQGPRRADWPRRPDRIIVAISAANPHNSSPPAANVAATSTTSAAGVTTPRMGHGRRVGRGQASVAGHSPGFVLMAELMRHVLR